MGSDPRFVVDINVGNLAKWLRIMGYDTLFPREAGDNDLVRIALRENRILVTRDSGFGRRRAVRLGQMRVVEISGDDFEDQLRQLVQKLHLALRIDLTRCVICNEPLETIAKEDVADRLPPFVYKTQSKFNECSKCLRLYWQGTHWTKIVSTLARVCEEGE